MALSPPPDSLPDDDADAAVAFRISVNDEPYCEAEDLATVTMVVEELRRRGERRITLYASANEGQVHWMTASLSVGDRIVIEVIDVAAAGTPEPRRCDFCGLDQVEVRSLIQSVAGSVCDVCISSLSAAVRLTGQLPVGASFRDDPRCPCRFCRKAPPAVQGVIVRNGAAICPECLRSAADILGDGPGPEE